MFSKTKIIFSINILGLLVCTNTVFAGNFITDWYNTTITGRIDSPIQQGCSNTCWLLSAVTGLNQTETGKAIIADTIKSDDNGGAVVTFKGLPNNPINVSATELAQFDSLNSTNKLTFSTGNANMRALEIAAQKVYQGGDFPSRLADDVVAGRIGSDKNFTFELLTGSNETSNQAGGISWLGSFFLPKNITRLSDSDINNFNNSDQYSTVSFFKDGFYAIDINSGKQQEIVSNYKHEYTIISSDNDSINLFNPWGNNLKMSRDDFLAAKPTVWTQKLDLNMALPETDLFSFLNEVGVVFDYELTDEDYEDIFGGYDFYEDFDFIDSDGQEVVGDSDYELTDEDYEDFDYIPSIKKVTDSLDSQDICNYENLLDEADRNLHDKGMQKLGECSIICNNNYKKCDAKCSSDFCHTNVSPCEINFTTCHNVCHPLLDLSYNMPYVKKRNEPGNYKTHPGCEEHYRAGGRNLWEKTFVNYNDLVRLLKDAENKMDAIIMPTLD